MAHVDCGAGRDGAGEGATVLTFIITTAAGLLLWSAATLAITRWYVRRTDRRELVRLVVVVRRAQYGRQKP